MAVTADGPRPGRQIVLVDCPDDVGLIHRITGVLGARGLNIETNQEFVDDAGGHFFFRAEVEPVGATVAPEALAVELARTLPAQARVRVAH